MMDSVFDELKEAAEDLIEAAADGIINPLEAMELAGDALSLLRRIRLKRNPARMLKRAAHHEQRARELREAAEALV